MNTKILENIGLTGGEIKVFLTLLKLGNSTTGPMILKSNVARSKVYEILEKLKEKGLVTESIKSNTKYFQATDPEKILDYIKTKQNNLRSQETEFKKILPELKLRQKLEKDTQEAKIYVGTEGIKSLYNELLNQLDKNNEYLAMTFSDKSLENKSITHMFQDFHKKRAEKKAKAKILCNIKDKLTQKNMNYSQTELYEFKTTKQIIPTGIAIVKDTVITFNWSEKPKAFAIICKENADQYRKFFYHLWNNYKF